MSRAFTSAEKIFAHNPAQFNCTIGMVQEEEENRGTLGQADRLVNGGNDHPQRTPSPRYLAPTTRNLEGPRGSGSVFLAI